jgi:Transcriptional regulators
MVGVAVLDISNPFFMEAAAGMERRLGEGGCVMLLSSTHADTDEEASLLRTLEGQGVRGILLTPTDSNLSVALEVVGRGTPIILFDSTAAPPEMSSISIDDHAGAVLAINHLLELGHHRIAFLNGPRRVRQARDRAAGVDHALHGSTHPVSLDVIELKEFTASAGRRAVTDMLVRAGVPAPRPGGGGAMALTSPPKLPSSFPTALFCANDLIAFGALTALRDSGIRVPDDISLVGFDDIPIAAQTSVPLTTVRQPMDELGWAAADMLLSPGPQVRHEKFFPELVVRASTREPT